jgi:hypothetical protein
MRFGIDINCDISLIKVASNRLDDKISILRRSRNFLFATAPKMSVVDHAASIPVATRTSLPEDKAAEA